MIFLVIGKMPKKGFSKTRLAQDIGEEMAQKIYRCMMEDFFSRLEDYFPDAKLYFFYTPALEVARKYFSSFFSNFKFESILHPQPDSQFFARLVRGLELIREKEGDVEVHITATDIPDFPFDFLLSQKQKSEVTIGPDIDGGFYYCGLGTKNSEYLNIDSLVKDGDSSVLQVLKKHIEQNCGASVTMLDSWQDIDTIEDLKCFKKRWEGDCHQYKTLEKLEETWDL